MPYPTRLELLARRPGFGSAHGNGCEPGQRDNLPQRERPYLSADLEACPRLSGPGRYHGVPTDYGGPRDGSEGERRRHHARLVSQHQPHGGSHIRGEAVPRHS